VRFIDEHKDVFGAEPICRVLTEHGAPIAPSTYYAAKSRPASAPAVRDGQLKAEITRVWKDNYDRLPCQLRPRNSQLADRYPALDSHDRAWRNNPDLSSPRRAHRGRRRAGIPEARPPKLQPSQRNSHRGQNGHRSGVEVMVRCQRPHQDPRHQQQPRCD
jgi:hypothetical protein